MQSGKNFVMLEELADVLGGAGMFTQHIKCKVLTFLFQSWSI